MNIFLIDFSIVKFAMIKFKDSKNIYTFIYLK